MPKTGKESGGGMPPFDPSKILGQLKSIVSPAKKTSGGKSWLGALVAAAVVLVGVAVWSWISWRRGRELAKLRHEKNKAKILADKAAVDLRVANNAKSIAAEQKKLDQASNDLRLVDADIRAEEARYEADQRAIDSIRSWRDAGVS